MSKKGSSEAHGFLGFIYSQGLGVAPDQAKALIHYTFGAMGNDTLSMMSLAYRYQYGIGSSQVCDASVKYYFALANTGTVVIAQVTVSNPMLQWRQASNGSLACRTKGFD